MSTGTAEPTPRPSRRTRGLPPGDRLERRDLLRALGALKRGDFSVRLRPDFEGVDGKIADAFNEVVEINARLASELERLARRVGEEGRITQRARLGEVRGCWAASEAAVNSLISDLVHPTSETARVIGAVARGDLSQTMALELEGRPLRGEFLRTAKTVNTMVQQLGSFASEVTRVAREVGTDGKLGGQAQVKGAGGTWKDLIDNVNLMASNLTAQVRNIAEVTTAVATGDLSKKVTVNVKGEILDLKNTVNTMVDQLSSFADEVTRVAREVGTEGKLGGQAVVKGISGTWKDLTDNVNLMASNLTGQVRNIAEVATAVANGDLSKKITVDVKGEILELKNTLNVMVDQLNSFAAEVTRVAREVGTEGKLGGQADVKGVAGVWRGLTENVNLMAGNLTGQVRNIAEVATAVANGDLSKKITVDVKGEILELKNTLNVMVDQLNSFAAEVTRVAREVGTEGKLGGQADVKGVAGVWKDLTDNVNLMAGNLTGQVRNIAEVTTAIANGDLSKKIAVDVKGEILELKNTVNTMVDQLSSFADEVTRVAREVGTEGKLGGQAVVKGISGTWKDLTDNVNFMAGNLTSQVRNIAAVTTAVATGDLSKKVTVDVKGEILDLKNTVNTMVDQLSSFADEVTRVAREVGTEGKLGGQAVVKGISGTWKDLTDNVNFMAGNLTSQVRGIAKVVTAVANGDLNRKLALEAKGEIAELADTINGMIETLAIFADQVTTVAREVGVEGKLGGQASVPGAAGTWKDLTDNVNQLAANLTTQMRAIAEVATAVTTGDLTRSITVATRGEVAALKDNINEMIRHLRDTTQKNSEQDWLKTNLAKFSRMLQGQKDLLTVGRLILSELAPVVSAQHGVFYILDSTRDEPELRLLASYAHTDRQGVGSRFKLGQGLVGQCALEKNKILLTSVPSDYIVVSSGLGQAAPLNVIVLPVVFEGQVKAVLELASFDCFNTTHQAFLDQLTETVGIVLNTIEANTRTEDLLKQSQSLAKELQNQQEELRQTNQQLEEKAGLLFQQNAEVERKNQEIEQARQALEEKAKQLALTSKYKSEFLANMSHELRTPLNSLLILSDQLWRNPDGNLSSRQTQFLKTIHSSGTDLLMLINDILDLSKIESGTVAVDVGEVRFVDLALYVERTFQHVADARGLRFSRDYDADLPAALRTDAKRLQQVLKNLLSNAFKFTERGDVSIAVRPVHSGWNPDCESLNRARGVVAFSVTDTGIGIPANKQSIIFEAFQQADGSTSRRYGGTGLGLAISREIAQLLGGDIRVTSTPGVGSTFTLYLPEAFAPPQRLQRPAAQSESAPLRTSAASDEPSDVGVALDDREELGSGDRALLIVDNDERFSELLLDVARERGWKGIVASSGARAVALARELQPAAITLDIRLPDIDGFRVLRRLKADPDTRHLPVQVISTDDDAEKALALGAWDVLRKPVETREAIDAALDALRAYAEQPQREVAVVTEGPGDFAELLAGRDVSLVCEPDLSALRRETSCAVLDARHGTTDPREAIGEIRARTGNSGLPVVVFAPPGCPAEVSREERERAASDRVRYADSLAEVFRIVCLMLHRRLANLSPAGQKLLADAEQSLDVLTGRKVLVVDDDVRNIFAMTSVLERQEMDVLSAENGQVAIQQLQAHPDVDIVLMDIMMPGMDGFGTMRAIRRMPRFRSLPIVAVTAKAMKGDREKTIDAGAWDYLSKPVEPARMLSVMRAWLLR